MLFVFVPDSLYHQVPGWVFALSAVVVLGLLAGIAWLGFGAPRHLGGKAAPLVLFGIGCAVPALLVVGLIAWNFFAWTTAYLDARALDAAPRCNGEPVRDCVAVGPAMIIARSRQTIYTPRSDEWLRLRLADGTIETPYAPAFNATGMSTGNRVWVSVWRGKIVTVISTAGAYIDTYDNPHTTLQRTGSWWLFALLVLLLFVLSLIRFVVPGSRRSQPSQRTKSAA